MTTENEQKTFDLESYEFPNRPIVSVIIEQIQEYGLEIQLGTKPVEPAVLPPSIYLERRREGWAIVLNPIGDADCSGVVYFHDDGRSFVVPNRLDSDLESDVIQVLNQSESFENPILDEIDGQEYIRVEYDLDYYGGDYSKVGDFALVPRKLCRKMGSVKKAFKASTNIEPVHMIHYSEDELYDKDGELIEG